MRALIIAGAVLAIGLVVIVIARVAGAQSSVPSAPNGRLITVHDRGTSRVFLSRADTIGEALKEANIPFNATDAVEPAANEQLVATDYQVNIYRSRPVIVVDGATSQVVMTPYQTPIKIAKHAGIALYDEDATTITPVDDIVSEGAGLRMAVDRATPFSFTLYGKKTDTRTQATTVGEMLKEKGVALAPNDVLSVDQSTPITPGMTIELWRNGVQTITQDEEIKFETEQIKDADQPVGYKKVQTPGIAGKKTVTYEIEMKNGQEFSRKEIQSVTTKEAIKQVEVVGVKATNTFTGDFAEALARLRSCEGSYTSNTGNGYYGAYQYDLGTWANYKGFANASLAPPSVQDEKAWITYQARGWQPWPSCKIKMGLQDIYR